MKDRNSVYVFVNETYAADLKMKPQEISGKTDYDLFPEELAEEYISDEKRIMAKGQMEDIEEEYVREGQTGFVHTVRTPVRDENGDTIGILGIFEDITERKRNEEKLQKSCAHLEELVSNRAAELETVKRDLQREVGERRRAEERLQELEGLRTLREQYQALLENAKETILVLQGGRLKFGNPQVFAISGYTEEELTARAFQEFIHPDDRETFEFYLKKLEQEKFPQVRPFRLILMTDVTDRKQAGEELRNSIETFRTLVNAMEKYFLL
jgi:PAS domain S-box-containing protein